MVRLESHQRSLDHRFGSKRLRGPVLVSKSNARHGQAPDFRRPVPKHLLVSRSARPAVFLLGFRTISPLAGRIATVRTMSAREKSAVPAQQHGPPSPPRRRLVVYAILRAAGSLRRLSADI